MDFKAGSVVRLKSYGPAMTIERVGRGNDGAPTADCIWFEGSKAVRGTFPLSTLMADEEEPPGPVIA